jgi:hypothetical protein
MPAVVATATEYVGSDTQVDAVYHGVVDCAIPPVAFTSISSAYGVNLVDGFVSMVADTAAGAKVMRGTYARVKKQMNPDAELKNRLAVYFAKRFTREEAQNIVESCKPDAGFKDKALYTKFQDAIEAIRPYVRAQALVVTTAFIGMFMTEVSKDVELLSPNELGFDQE